MERGAPTTPERPQGASSSASSAAVPSGPQPPVFSFGKPPPPAPPPPPPAKEALKKARSVAGPADWLESGGSAAGPTTPPSLAALAKGDDLGEDIVGTALDKGISVKTSQGTAQGGAPGTLQDKPVLKKSVAAGGGLRTNLPTGEGSLVEPAFAAVDDSQSPPGQKEREDHSGRPEFERRVARPQFAATGSSVLLDSSSATGPFFTAGGLGEDH